MSECNRCTLRYIRDRASRRGLRVTLVQCVDIGGVNVYVHPITVSVEELEPDAREPFFEAWFMAVPDACVC